ncbi:MAG: hypothetical protein RJB38_250 [Pseudomonadota bacterium]|jgi:chromosome segregation ATPase
MPTVWFLVGLSLVFGSRESFAQGKKRPSEVQYSKTPLIEDHSEALAKSWKELDGAYGRSADQVAKAADRYRTKLEQAETYRKQAQDRMEEADREVAGYQAELDHLGEKLQHMSKSSVNDSATQAKLSESKKTFKAMGARIDDLREEAEKRRKDYEKAARQADQLKAKVNQTLERDFGMSTRPGEPLADKLDQLANGIYQQRQIEGAARITDQFLDQVKEDYLKSGILVSDLKTLQLKRGYTQAQLDVLQEKFGERLDNTLLGRYIEDKVSQGVLASCRDPKVALACAEAREKTLQALRPAASGDVPAEVGDRGTKTPDSTPADDRERETEDKPAASAK